MKKFNQDQLLNLFAILFVVLIVISAISLRSDGLKYQLTANETLDLLNQNPAEMTKEDVQMLLDNPNSAVKFIDIRENGTFQKGHLPGATNIPVANLLDPEYKSFLKDTTHLLVLYGRNKVQAYGPCVLFQRMGMNHVKYIPGSYDSLNDTFAFSDSPRYDYQKVFNESQKAVRAATTEPVVTKPKKINLLPKPVRKVVVEEEEGC